MWPHSLFRVENGRRAHYLPPDSSLSLPEVTQAPAASVATPCLDCGSFFLGLILTTNFITLLYSQLMRAKLKIPGTQVLGRFGLQAMGSGLSYLLIDSWGIQMTHCGQATRETLHSFLH